MKEILTNDICEFEILFKHDLITKHTNILTTVFFKRDQYYKNFGIYIKGLQRLVNFVDDNKSNPYDKDHPNNHFKLLIFIDQNIKDDQTIMNIIKNSKYTIPVLFKCSEYMTGQYHTDLFGTLVRFFPMMDLQNNPFNISICVDVDLHDEDYSRVVSLIKHKPKGITVSADMTKIFYHNSPPYAFAGMISYNKPKTSFDILSSFIKNADKIESKGNYGKRETTFGYGIDEIFLNDYLLKSVDSFKIIIDYQLSYFFYHSKPRLLDKSMIDVSNELLSILLGSFNDVKMTPEEKINFIDKSTYQIKTVTDINDELSRNFSQILTELAKIKKYWFEHKVQDFMYKYLSHIISTILVVETNSKGDIKGVRHYDSIHDTDYIPHGYIFEH
jgi:hypothetical protein